MSSYIYPSIISLPLWYRCAVPLQVHQMAERITTGQASLDFGFEVYREGKLVRSDKRTLLFRGGRLQSGDASPIVWENQQLLGETAQAYGELTCKSSDDKSVFSSMLPFSMYSIYYAPGRKSVFSDNNFKYGAPPIIDQMAEFGQYVETYPVINLDLEKDLGESLALINPYTKTINVRIITSDKRDLRRIQVGPRSCRHVSLLNLLREDERTWQGQIQLTANNRLIVFHIKQSARSPGIISDHEHLDPYRAEPTHWPVSLLFRTVPGAVVRNVQSLKRRIANARHS
jgi:hypothetical protein